MNTSLLNKPGFSCYTHILIVAAIPNVVGWLAIYFAKGSCAIPDGSLHEFFLFEHDQHQIVYLCV